MVTKLNNTATSLWDFVIDLRTGNLHDIQLSVDDAHAIHEIVLASKEVVKEETEIHKLLNNIDEQVIK